MSNHEQEKEEVGVKPISLKEVSLTGSFWCQVLNELYIVQAENGKEKILILQTEKSDYCPQKWNLRKRFFFQGDATASKQLIV